MNVEGAHTTGWCILCVFVDKSVKKVKKEDLADKNKESEKRN